jgi:two-component system chemotaxis response regulator CheY
VRLFVKTVVGSLGWTVVAEAADGRRAVESFDKTTPDLVLLDVNMPLMDGIAALKALREKSDSVAIIMLTSLASAEVVEQCLEAGATYHLRKDLPVSELKEELRDAWDAHVEDQQGDAG